MEITIAPYAPLLNYKKWYTPEFVEETINKMNLKGMRIFAHLKDQKLESLDFLKEYTFLKELHISCIDEHDYNFLKYLSNLKGLRIDQSITEKNTIDLRNLVNLEYLHIYWRKKIIGLEKCKKLKKILLWSFKEKDLCKLHELENLNEIRIGTASIQSFDGVQNMQNLENIIIGNCRYLKSIKAVNSLQNLKILDFDTCSKIEDYDSLTDLPILEKLVIKNCKDIKSIQFLKNLPSLKKLIISANSKILDGDVKPAQHIDWVFIRQWKHYNMISKNSKEEGMEQYYKELAERQKNQKNIQITKDN
ncbi:MAG: hypothetical protein RO257_10090 [Candidatus Kapabacteria bacterium]|nr:hypothetical protein [Candidatus Kapabacteria bacterium]